MIEVYKGYQIKPNRQYPNNYVVAVDGKGGSIPKVLDTLFTSRGIAREAVDFYLNNKQTTEETDNASEAKPTRRGK